MEESEIHRRQRKRIQSKLFTVPVDVLTSILFYMLLLQSSIEIHYHQVKKASLSEFIVTEKKVTWSGICNTNWDFIENKSAGNSSFTHLNASAVFCASKPTNTTNHISLQAEPDGKGCVVAFDLGAAGSCFDKNTGIQ